MKPVESAVANPWPTLIVTIDWPDTVDLNASLYFACRERIAALNEDTLNRDNANLFIDFSESPAIQKLTEMFLFGFKEIFRHYNQTIPQSTKENVADSWVNFEQTGRGTRIHNHQMSIFSAVYYINAKPAEGVLHLYDPRWVSRDAAYVGRLDHTLEPRSGQMAIFPGNVWHEVRPFDMTEPRVAAVSNYTFVPTVRSGARPGREDGISEASIKNRAGSE